MRPVYVEYHRHLHQSKTILSRPKGEQASTVAYAAHCQQEATLDRPIAGHTNICPKAIKDTKNDIQGLASTIKHEMLHALGFSSSLFAFFRDKEGKPLTERGEDGKPPINQRLQIRQWSDKIIKKVLISASCVIYY